VLELVEGETLAEQLRGCALPVDEGLEVCKQIAEALEAAHEHGVIHRDLKPANVKVTPDGIVKVLDFGLAKAFVGDTSAAVIADSPTITAEHTRPGVVLGTAAYMSPEQARGKPLDKRTDIWSFGCVLYECLTGRRPFQGETTSDTIAKILEREPDWDTLPPSTPPIVQLLLRRCLQKDRRRRLHDIADARIEIDEALSQPDVGWPGVAAPVSQAARRPRALLWGLLALSAMGALVLGFFFGSSIRREQRPAPMHIPVAVAPDLDLTYKTYPTLAISPDGRRLALAPRSNGTRLYVQELDQPGGARPIPGTEGAINPFFSPDGQWVGFFVSARADAGTLWKVDLSGGTPIELVDIADFWGASWMSDDEILFTEAPNVMRVSAAGGTPTVVTTPDLGRGEFAHTWPQMLPGGEDVLYIIAFKVEKSRIAVTSLATGKQTILFEGGIYARYVPTGHIVFAQGNSLMAMSFDPDRLQTGAPGRILENIVARRWGAALYALSQNGSLAYLSASPEGRQTLVRIDPEGTRRLLTSKRHQYGEDFRFSPDGQRVALEISDHQGGTDLWIYDVLRDDLSRLTFEPGWEDDPVWSADGRKVAFSSDREAGGVFWKRADGSGPVERLVGTGMELCWPSSWSPDGKRLAFVQQQLDTRKDIWIHSTEKPEAPQVFLATRFNERSPVFSPDGRWIAYQSDQTGHAEIYVRPYPGPGPSWKVSTGSGHQPRWSSDGRRIFFREGSRAMVALVQEGPEFSTSLPEVLFDGLGGNWDVSPDGAYFITLESEPREPPRLNLVINWFEELEAKVPTGRSE
jgi:serine/threonine-protein kinase